MSAGSGHKHAYDDVVSVPEVPAHQPAPFVMTDIPAAQGPAPAAELVPVAGWVAGEDSPLARRIQIRRREDNRLLASAVVTPAEASTLLARLDVDQKPLSKCLLVSDLALDARDADDLLAPLLYFCLRRARIEERPMIMTACATRDVEGASLLRLDPLPRLGTLEVSGRPFLPLAQRVDISIHEAFFRSELAMRELEREYFVAEVVEVLDRWTDNFFETPFFRAIYEGTMTKEQYVYSLSQLYQFVRWTTRLIGLAVNHSHDKVVRRKWLEHLQEEVDHEVIIEKDLAALGVDVKFVIESMTPNVPNQQFMVAQESSIGFHQDPVLFMASPMGAEGFAARLDQRFIDALYKTVKSWGVANPKQCTVFWVSHLSFDGGDDGHYEHSRRILHYCLKTDTELAKFLNSLRLALVAMEKSYTSYIEDLAIFAAAPRKAK